MLITWLGWQRIRSANVFQASRANRFPRILRRGSSQSVEDWEDGSAKDGSVHSRRERQNDIYALL